MTRQHAREGSTKVDDSRGVAALQAAMDDFLHSAVHDIRGPLGQVRALTVLLERQYKHALNEEGKELCGLIEQASKRAIAVVDSIRAYAEVLEAPAFEAADLNAIVDAAYYGLQSIVEETGAVVTRDDLPALRVDRRKVLTLFEELFRNALKFRGEAAPRIHCSAESDDHSVLFFVTDNGAGVPASQAEKIFKPLKRLHSHDFDGSGMGLAICRRIVEIHGGKIWVETRSAGGADFRFTLSKAEN